MDDTFLITSHSNDVSLLQCSRRRILPRWLTSFLLVLHLCLHWPLSAQVFHEMYCGCYLLVLFYAGLTLAQPLASIYNFSELNCSSLCGLPFQKTTLELRYSYSDKKNVAVNLNGLCVRESELSIGDWKKSARRFLQLINMNDGSFDCPKWNMVFRKPKETELLKFWTERVYSFSHKGKRSRYNPSFKTWVVEPARIPGHCGITVDRGVVERNRHVYLMDANIQYGRNPSVTIGSIVSLWLKPDLGFSKLTASIYESASSSFQMENVPVHLQQNHSKGCRGNDCAAYEVMWLPASTFGTSVPHRKHTTEHYSIFAKWNFQQIPGMDSLLMKLRESVSHLENVGNELSPSNIAILSLPLLMAMLPISLFQEVSTAATAWYVFVSDILVAVPLLIKGIELVIVYPKTKVKMYSTLSMAGRKYGVYERWFTECNPPVGITHTAGIILVSLALWFMMASSYAEFAFWRAIRFRHGRLNTIQEIPSDAINEDSEEVDESKSSESEEMNNSWYARYRNHILVGTFLCLFALFIVSSATRLISRASRSTDWDLYNGSTVYLASGLVKIFTIVVLVFFHLIGMNRFSKLRRCWCRGFIFGVVGGPLYLILHVKKNVRESKNWGRVSDSANIGMALSGTYLALSLGGFFPFHLMFTWLYGSLIILLHAIRSSPTHRVRWRYGFNEFAAGMLFGPFGILFKRCFPETMKDEQASANFHGGFAFGVIFLLTVINLMVSYWEYIAR